MEKACGSGPEEAASRGASGDTALDVTRLSPSPPVAEAEAAEAVRACFGLSGELARLPGEADDNFLFHAGDHERYVVKVAHQRADPAVVGVQVRVLRHIESAAPGLPVPRVRSPPMASRGPWWPTARCAGGSCTCSASSTDSCSAR